MRTQAQQDALQTVPFSIEDLYHSVQELNRQLIYGCGNHGCVIRKPLGMATNASCRCGPTRIARDLRKLADAVESVGWEWPKIEETGQEAILGSVAGGRGKCQYCGEIVNNVAYHSARECEKRPI